MTRYIIAPFAALALAACSEAESDDVQQEPANQAQSGSANGDMTPSSVDVVEVASANGNVDTFLEAAVSAGIGETLANAEQVTIFAPIDEAFGAVEGFDQIRQDREQLASLLRRHAVPQTYLSRDIPQGETQVETLSGETLTITNENGQTFVTGPSGTRARIVEADIEGENGVVHAVDTVLVD